MDNNQCCSGCADVVVHIDSQIIYFFCFSETQRLCLKGYGLKKVGRGGQVPLRGTFDFIS